MYSVLGLSALDSGAFDTVPILKATVSAGRCLAELKGVAASIPNQAILINTLALQEAKDSSAIENIITTHDELFRAERITDSGLSAAAKEVRRYVQAMNHGFDAVRAKSLITNRIIRELQATIEGNSAGFRKLPGTVLKDARGRTVYTPPQDPSDVESLMRDLQRFINDNTFEADPLVKMAIIHHQFESIHPFYDGNGRTGRIINVLYLVQQGLLDIPVLYLSRHIVRSKRDYYRLLQNVRDTGEWQEWILYMLRGVEDTAGETIATINDIQAALLDYKQRLRARCKFYSQDLVNNLFQHPYTKIEFVVRDLSVSRLTATKYLEQLTADGFLAKHRHGRSSFYMNVGLVDVLTRVEDERAPSLRESKDHRKP
ncbi:MAG: Fic family protein [Gemmatimonadaceae bacterium]